MYTTRLPSFATTFPSDPATHAADACGQIPITMSSQSIQNTTIKSTCVASAVPTKIDISLSVAPGPCFGPNMVTLNSHTATDTTPLPSMARAVNLLEPSLVQSMTRPLQA